LISVHDAPTERPPIALTCGDPAGIGPDITLQSWLRRESEGLPSFVLLGDPEHLAKRAREMDLAVPIVAVGDPGEAERAFADSLPVLPVPLPCPVEAGRPEPVAAPAVKLSIERAVALAMSGDVSAVVTNPIAKHIMAAAGFPYPGHTEFLGALARDHGEDASPVMMLASDELRVVLVTIHEPLAAVPGLLTGERIIDTVRVAVRGLQRWFGIPAPRLAMTGLNPHAGENGLIGTEERTIIAPAIAALRGEGFQVTGPHPADTMFHARARQAYDAAVTMYHDQALIPLKTLAFDEGVNVTLGLPFIRTSPDHGTAFDIAGTLKARPDSLIAALRLAAKMADNDTHAAAAPIA
jgi:4-hydroxythreonine-4-phosphate dehydrogenase